MQKHELTLHGLYVWAQFLSGGLDVNREVLSDMKLKLNWVADLKKFLLVDQAGDSELIFSHDWNGKTIVKTNPTVDLMYIVSIVFCLE